MQGHSHFEMLYIANVPSYAICYYQNSNNKTVIANYMVSPAVTDLIFSGTERSKERSPRLGMVGGLLWIYLLVVY